MPVDLNKLTTINTNYSKKKQVGDLRISKSQEMVYVSEELYARLGLQTKGFKFHYNPDTKEIFFSLHPVEEAVMYKGESKQFTSSKFFDYLDILNKFEDADEIHADLTFDSEQEGVKYYRFEVVEKEKEQEEEMMDPVADNSLEEEDEEDFNF